MRLHGARLLAVNQSDAGAVEAGVTDPARLLVSLRGETELIRVVYHVCLNSVGR